MLSVASKLDRWMVGNRRSPQARRLYLRHYSSAKRPAHADPKQFIGPGEPLVLLTIDAKATFIWRMCIDDCELAGGVNCAIFRNEAPKLYLSSDLIREADELAWHFWPNELRHYTYVDAAQIRSINPGCCFKKAGWRKCGVSDSGKLVLHIVRGGGA